MRELLLAPEGCPGERLGLFWIPQEIELGQRVGVNLGKNVPRVHLSRDSDINYPLVACFN